MKKKILIGVAIVMGLMAMACGVGYHCYKHRWTNGLYRWYCSHQDSKQVASVKPADDLLNYCKRMDLDTECYITVDFTLPSSERRLTVRRYRDGKVLFSSLCAHGDGSAPYRSTDSEAHFSNRVGSKSSCVGRFMLTEVGKARRGFQVIKLEGLDATNSNAAMRGIYIHSSGKVTRNPQGRLIPVGNKTSEGCFVVSAGAFQRLKQLLQHHPRMLLYAYNQA